MDFKNKKVLIFGLGLNDGGLGMTEYFLKQGAQVTVTDGKTKQELKETIKKIRRYGRKITYHLGGHLEEDFKNNDIIIRNPAIKNNNQYLEIARKEGKEIYMEMALFHKLCPCPIIGVTGTRGKSTTTTLIYEFLKEKYDKKLILGGNIGKSAIRELPNLTEENLVVLEISSFQLENMGEVKLSPQTAVVTNMFEDHLNWHKDMKEYIDAKKNIFLNQNPEDLLVVNIDNKITSKFPKEAKGKVTTYSLKYKDSDYYLDPSTLEIFERGNLFMQIEELILDGQHNLYNILSAIATVRSLHIEKESISKVLKTFPGVQGRQQFVRELKGVKFFNDTTATSVEAMIAMFERFGEKYKGKIVMISGGVDKGLNYEKITPLIKKYVKELVLFEGTASEKIYTSLKDWNHIHKYYPNMKEAVSKAYKISSQGDMVILCPGASSFNMFSNEFDRGDQFVKLVKRLR